VTGAPYPAAPEERTRWIRERRGPRNEVDPSRAYAAFVENERDARGRVVPVATVFLTNRECPWTCAMCDLWRNTTEAAGPAGSAPRQIRAALAELPGASVLKLYNSGSFFDSGAIPRADWPAIAELCRGFERIIVESHPRLVGPAVLEFAGMIGGTLEVAMGLETCHPAALHLLNKRIAPADFWRACAFLKAGGIQVRSFVLVRPPFVPEPEQTHWLRKSTRFALDSGSDVVALIPTRLGNGALEALGAREPALVEIEAAQEFGISLGAGRVFADTWDLARFSHCDACAEARSERLARMNLAQTIEPRVNCAYCE
jgi:uncharacterized Fe-S cluster-containing MiaB family protein